MIADTDLIAMQQARLIAENACEAQKKLLQFGQEKLDTIMKGLAAAAEKHCAELAALSCEETGCGNARDEEALCRFLRREVPARLRGVRCVGPLESDSGQLREIGVPVGVICALCPVTSPVATIIVNALLAVKSGNALVFALHAGAARSMRATLDMLKAAADSLGLPEGCLAYVETPAERGTLELMGHSAVALVLATGEPALAAQAAAMNKAVIYGGHGGGPAFIERSADAAAAVRDIMKSKCFNNGILPSTEQALVVDAPVVENVRLLLREAGAYFLQDAEADMLAAVLFGPDGRQSRRTVGVSAMELAAMAGLSLPENVRVLLVERTYVREADPYCRELLAPVAAFYVEEDWRHACEKCLELLLVESGAHTLAIHTRDVEVVQQFALRKPVARLLVNTGGAFGGIGMTTELFPAMTLCGGMRGHENASENLCPEQLIYRRKICPGIRPAPVCAPETDEQGNTMTALQLALRAAIHQYHFAHRV